MKTKIYTLVLGLLIQTKVTAQVFDTHEHKGNHTTAKSEAWTWMGHLVELDQSKLTNRGYAFIHYYTRNETGMGRMNFKSSAVTPTLNGIGQVYDKLTIFPDQNQQSFSLATKEKSLDLEFNSNQLGLIQRDRIYESTFDDSDNRILCDKLMPLFPGLALAPGFHPEKFVFSAYLGKTAHVDLTMYAIWPDIAPPQGQMEFFGIKDSYTFSSPMLVTYGTWQENGSIKTVAGLSFLDRQWSQDYFGKNIFDNPVDFFSNNHALKKAHNWSAMHLRSQDSKDYYFVHLWQQYARADEKADEVVDYTGVQWSKNGIQQEPVPRSDITWQGLRFTENESNVLMDFAYGRKGLFPYLYELTGQAAHLGHSLRLTASPKMQSLDQPIYLFEGYASGQGFWDHHPVTAQGRVESSQILFRDQDYQAIINTIDEERTDTTDTIEAEEQQDQLQLRQDLLSFLQHRNRCQPWTAVCPYDAQIDQANHNQFLFNDMPMKMNIFRSQFANKPQRNSADPSFVVYH